MSVSLKTTDAKTKTVIFINRRQLNLGNRFLGRRKEVREMATIETLKKEIKQMKKNLKEAEAKLAAMKAMK